jgi:nicotinamidase-related amidase
MSDKIYDSIDTALLVVDPYNDFMSEGGKLYDQIKEVADSVGMFGNLRKLIPAARSAGLKVFVLPHRQYQEGDYENWRQRTATQVSARETKAFERGSWGGQFHPEFGPQKGDVVVHEHWAQSSFANTDLDFQLKQHDIRKIILVGMVANSCIESTGRFGMELGYHVTLVKDATAAFSKEAMHAALEVNGPTFAHAILTTAQLITAIGK